MKYRVQLVVDAEEDLFDLCRYVAEHDSPGAAQKLLDRLEAACRSLSALPERGHAPPELERIGIAAYREIDLAPYRIIYRIAGKSVFVHAILDGRRHVVDLLHWRLVR